MKKSSVIGACVLAAAVVLSVPLGVHTSLTSLREEANSSYCYDKTGFAIWEGIENREAAASNMITVAERYTDDNPSLTVADMNAQCRRIKNLGLVVIDYLQLMQSAGSGNSWSNESRTQAVSDISRMMKIMAKELNVPVLCLSQLSRANTQRQNKRPQLSDLRESGAIEQDADVVVALHREGYYDPEYENPNEVELIILKNRRGETGTLYMMWLPEYTSFVPLDKRHEE